jgi:hypothetical protein
MGELVCRRFLVNANTVTRQLLFAGRFENYVREFFKKRMSKTIMELNLLKHGHVVTNLHGRMSAAPHVPRGRSFPLLLCLLLGGALAHAQGPTITLVQHTSLDAGTVTSSTLGFTSNNTAGNWIAVVVRAGNSSSQAFTITDSNGNIYHQALQLGVTANPITVGIYYAENIKGGANTITVSDTVLAPLRFAILEYAGVATTNSLDVTATAQGISTSPNSGNATTTSNGDLLLGAVVATNTAVFTAGTGYKIEESVPAEPNTKLIGEDQIQSISGIASASASLAASDNWGAGLAAFKAAGGGGGTGPHITSLSQAAGAVGTAITITGTNFGATQGTSTVTFNGTGATVSTWSATSIAVTVPAGAITGNVVVTVSGVMSNGVVFTVTSAPSITNLNPTSGPVGALVTITGANFGATQGTSTVSFNGTGATVSTWSATSIAVTVPAGALTGNVVVTVSGVMSNAVVFTVTPAPSITNVSPTSGPVGAPVTITGANFGATQGTSTVTFNGTAATVSTWSATSIAVTAPAGALTGNVVVTVGGVMSNAVVFTVTSAPSITNVSPNSGPVGAPVTITGANYGATQGTSTVTFNGTTATVSTWSATSIAVTVPAGAMTGNVVVTVGGVMSNAVVFTVTPAPSITNVSPNSGPVGAPVTITGANFGATQGTSTVAFNGTTATVSTWSATSIAVTVPAGAMTGNVVVTVGGVMSNAVVFTVTPAPSITNVSPNSGLVGAPVTITGANFGATQGTSTVTFNGTAATVSTWSATSIAVTVPAGAMTGNVAVTVSGVMSNAVAFTVNTANGITLIQHRSLDAGTVTLSALGFTSNNTAGNWIGVVIRAGNSSSQAFTITDSNGNTYRQALQLGVTGNPITLAIYYAENIKGGVNTVTVSDTVLGPLRFAILEYAGVATTNSLDVTAAAQGTSTSPNSGTRTTNGGGDLLLGAVVSTNTAVFTAGTGYKIEESVPAEPNTKLIAEDQIQSIAGITSVSASLAASDNWGAGFAAFRAACGGAAPCITSLIPTSGAIGAPITITGTSFGATQGTSTVTFNGTVATVSTWSATSIAVTVPVGALTGNVVVTVNGATSNGMPFTVAPIITNLSPTSGAVGTPITITGVNFGVSQGTSTVTFNGTTTTPTSWSATSIVVPVPVAATTGNVVVTVAGLASNGVNFTVPLSISPRVTSLTITRTQQFAAFNAGGGGVIWSVDGVTGGTSASGTITVGGLYTPPSATGTHTVTVTTADLLQSVSATVYITNYPGTFTRDVDNLRTGLNPNETVLTPANVNSAQFGKLFSYALDGVSDASPLYVANLNIPGKGFHNVVYVATEHDSVYAFDADGLQSAPLWQDSFINPAAGVTTVPAADVGACNPICDINPEIGITGSPVIDPATNTLYVVVKTKEVSGSNTTYVHRFHALDITTGAEKFGGPVVIQASVPGFGGGSVGGQVPFISLRENQRTALLLNNGVVYLAFASHGDQVPYHGWVLGYNASTLQQVMVYNTSPNATSFGAGIWMSGDGLAVDSTGNIYFVTGNGVFDVNTGGNDYGDSLLRINQTTGAVVDYFTPFDQSNMNANDLDLGSGGVLLLPDQSGAHPHLALTAGKNGTIYLVDRDNMGHFNPNNNNQIVQSVVNIFPGGTKATGNFKAPVYWNGRLFYSADADAIKSFSLTNGMLSTTPTSQSSFVLTYPGATLGFSANGNTNGILWAIQRIDIDPLGGGARGPGVLHAFDANNLVNELYNSNQASGSRDVLDFTAKWSAPLVANGKVFIASLSQLTILGLLP